MKQFTIWQAPFYSFWSKSFYIDVAKNWRGGTYLYLFLLICFTWVFMSIKKQMDFVYFADHQIAPVIAQMPVVTIDKGILSIDKPTPCTLKNKDGETIITFDTSDKPMALDSIPEDTYLVTKKAIYMYSQKTGIGGWRRDAGGTQADFSTFPDHVVFDQKAAHQFVSDLSKALPIIIFMIGVPVGFVFCLLQSLIYGLIGLIMIRLEKIDLSYGALVRLSAVAMTPALLIDSIIKVRSFDQTTYYLWPIVALIINLAYVIFAVYVNITNQDNKSESSIS